MTVTDCRASPTGARARRPRRVRQTHSCRRTCNGHLDLGVDIVLHSATKYLNGHSDSVGGVVSDGEQDAEWLKFIQNSVGGDSSRPSTRGSPCAGRRRWRAGWAARPHGRAVAAFLEEQPEGRKLYYPARSRTSSTSWRAAAAGFGAWSPSTWGRWRTPPRARRLPPAHAGRKSGGSNL